VANIYDSRALSLHGGGRGFESPRLHSDHPLAIDAMSPFASTEPPPVPRRAAPPQLRLQIFDSQALLLQLLQKSVPLPPKDDDASSVLGTLLSSP
jgi:hypothetical protein